jgi:3-dehydroquinate synthase
MSHPVEVSHALGSYPVYIEAGIIERLDTIAREHLAGRRVAMIADDRVFQLYQSARFGSVSWSGQTFKVPPGENSKSRESWTRLTDELLDQRFGRDSGLIGLGGGMIGDLTGFVAATYMRGVPYVLAPTTLLAMVDASVGGKTGVNTSHGKNLIGVFHPPVAVIADPLTLTTLPEKDYRGGLAEAVKHGLIADRTYFEWIEAQVPAITSREPKVVGHLVRRSVEIKAEVVSADERESGRRAILNAGHTVAHALEQASGYEIPHGEAVALGLVVECEIAERLGIAQQGLRHRVAGLLSRLGLPERLDLRLEPLSLVGSMAADKKNRGDRIHFALPARLGEMHRAESWTIPVPAEAITGAIRVLN